MSRGGFIFFGGWKGVVSDLYGLKVFQHLQE